VFGNKDISRILYLDMRGSNVAKKGLHANELHSSYTLGYFRRMEWMGYVAYVVGNKKWFWFRDF
jgi:hypothetical protein